MARERAYVRVRLQPHASHWHHLNEVVPCRLTFISSYCFPFSLLTSFPFDLSLSKNKMATTKTHLMLVSFVAVFVFQTGMSSF